MILYAPIKTEKAIAGIEFGNTLSFKVNPRSNKEEIKKAVESTFNVKVISVRTHLNQKGNKVAFVRLSKESNAEEVTAKLKIA